MKAIIAAILLTLSSLAMAGPFVEAGLAVSDGCLTDYDEKTHAMGCSNNPFGLLAIGYAWEGFTVEIEHRSSLVEKDKGINSVMVKYRIELK